MTDKIERTPFSDETVKHLTLHQLNPNIHPYTCGNCDSRMPLIVSRYGLECFKCGYNQDAVRVYWE